MVAAVAESTLRDINASTSLAVSCVKLSAMEVEEVLESEVRTNITSLRRENLPRTGVEENRLKSELNDRTISSNFKAPANLKLV